MAQAGLRGLIGRERGPRGWTGPAAGEGPSCQEGGVWPERGPMVEERDLAGGGGQDRHERRPG